MRHSAGIFLIVVFLACSAFACSHRVTPNLVYEGTRHSYERILDNWTRGDKVYGGIDCVLQVQATLISPEMESAINSERARTHGPDRGSPAPERQVLGMAVRPEVHMALIGVYTKAGEANDLGRDPSSWTVWLVNDRGVHVQAEAVITVKVKPEELRELVPYLDKWTRPYLALFPVADSEGRRVWDQDTNALNCVITGPLGRAVMTWSFK